MTPPELYAGLMSGTSMDGVDGVLVGFKRPGDHASAPADAPPLQVLAHCHLAFDDAFADTLLALNQSGPDELHRAALAGNAVARAYASVVHRLLASAGVAAAQVRAVGAHGQTVRHQPRTGDATGYTWQLLNAALLAELGGIDVVADFRSRDLAAGGVGAPLVPAFHRAMFGAPGETVAVLNLGGMANCTLLHADGRTTGFDTGPGNALLDGWHRRWCGDRYDAGGAWGAGGRVRPALLAAMQSEPYFTARPPKATGRDLFNDAWLAAVLTKDLSLTHDLAAHAQDVQASLVELTAWSAADAVRSAAPGARTVLVCGGGAHNRHLMERLQQQFGDQVMVTTTLLRALPPDQVEAAAFAWLAKAHLERIPANLPEVTGAAGLRVLGALYPAA